MLKYDGTLTEGYELEVCVFSIVFLSYDEGLASKALPQKLINPRITLLSSEHLFEQIMATSAEVYPQMMV